MSFSRVQSGRKATPPPRKPHDGRRGLEGVRVLVIEDDAASRKLETILLSSEGALVTAVVSAEEALAVLARMRPEVIVLDLVLPRMGGLTLVEQLKADPATEKLVFVAVTALNGPEAERTAKMSGCAGYIRKPVDAETFASVVASYRGEQK